MPRPMRTAVRTAYYSVLDVFDAITGNRHEFQPPRRLFYIGGGDYKKIGADYLHRFIHDCALKPEGKVLDIGCGTGRIAVPLMAYLNERGSYDGFDIDPRGILWCVANITAKKPNFRFLAADIYNEEYNPKGTQKAHEYRFPYADNTFDLVTLISVFTHMFPMDIEHYLREISRVTKPGGFSLITYYLFNKSKGYLNTRGGTLNFQNDCGAYRTISKEVPEAAVCCDEDSILGLYKKCGLELAHPVEYGKNRQDIIVARKPI